MLSPSPHWSLPWPALPSLWRVPAGWTARGTVIVMGITPLPAAAEGKRLQEKRQECGHRWRSLWGALSICTQLPRTRLLPWARSHLPVSVARAPPQAQKLDPGVGLDPQHCSFPLFWGEGGVDGKTGPGGEETVYLRTWHRLSARLCSGRHRTCRASGPLSFPRRRLVQPESPRGSGWEGRQLSPSLV